MTARRIAPGTRRSPWPLLTTIVLTGWLVAAGGCAQLGFPELPPGLNTVTAAATAQEEPPVADATVGAAEAVDAAPESEPEPQPQPQPKSDKLFQWSGDGRTVTRIHIDTDTQRARFYAGDEAIGWTTIATGVSSHPTPRGEFSILEKVRDKRSNLYGKIVDRNGRVLRGSAHSQDPVPRGARFVGANMPYFMRLTYDGIGLHAGPIPNPGQPASHGCIRLPPQVAQAVFAHVGPDTAVTVVGDGPDYGNYAERIARQRAEERARRAAVAAAAEGSALDALDAEIEALEEAGVRAPDAADDTSGRPASSTRATAAPGDRTTADDTESADQAAADGAGVETGTRSSTQVVGEPDRTAADAAPADGASASAGDGADAAQTVGRNVAPADAAQASEDRAGGRGSERDARSNAGSSEARLRQPHGEQREPETRPEAEAILEPEAAPPKPVPPYYGPPAPPPTLRSADTTPVQAAGV